jgi:hypothetical protein
MTHRRIAALVIAFVGCATAPAAAPRAPTSSWRQPMDEEDRAWLAQHEQELAAIREDVSPVIVAYRKKDEAALRGWATDPSRPSAYRTYAAYLLIQLGAKDANQLFVESFPVEDQEQYDWFDELNQALATPDTEDVNAYPQQVLICGAVQGWNGAAEKLIKLRSMLDAGAHMDNCCGLIRFAIAHPDEALARMTTESVEDGLLHVFKDEASPAEAAQLLQLLNGKTYDAPDQEQLRLQLLPVLTKKSKADGPTKVCEWLKCKQ